MPKNFPELFNDGIALERETVIKSVSKSISILCRARLIIPRKQLNQLYFSFVHSYLNYANLTWGSNQKTKRSTLYRQQKHSIGSLSFTDQFTHSRPLFKETCVLNIYMK